VVWVASLWWLQFILASSSSFFMNVLSKNPDIPLVYLSRIRFIDLIAILDFMYSGEVRFLLVRKI
jgi:hypothetical protein